MRKKPLTICLFVAVLSLVVPSAHAQAPDFRKATLQLTDKAPGFHLSAVPQFELAELGPHQTWYWDTYTPSAVPQPASNMSRNALPANMDFAPVSLNFNLSAKRPLVPVLNVVGFDVQSSERDLESVTVRPSLWTRATHAISSALHN